MARSSRRIRQKINYLKACVRHIILNSSEDPLLDHAPDNIRGARRTSGAMVSTRQMSNVGGGSGDAEQGRPVRHAGPAGGSSPHQGAVVRYALPPPPPPPPPPPRHFTSTTNLTDLPVEILEKILRLLGYKSVSQLRLVNRQFNTVCSSMLNSTFQKLQNQMLHRFHTIKSKMPRRESARRSHPLACESDIIETLHMRLSLLQMTFGKHIERKHCCFFPGDILDEVYSILSYLKTATKLARPYKVTDELFDLTTMAMEYFKEHIEPNLPEITYFGTDFFDITNTFSPGESSKSYNLVDSPPPAGMEASTLRAVAGPSGEHRPTSHSYMEESLPPSPPPPQSNMVLRKRIHRIKQGMKKYNDQLSALRSDLRGCKRKTALQQKQIAEQQKQLAEQQKQTIEYATRLEDYDKKNEETSRKLQALLQELNKCKTELQYWRSRSPAAPPLCAECGVALTNLTSSPELPASLQLQWAISGNPEALEAVASCSGEVSASEAGGGGGGGSSEPAPEKAAESEESADTGTPERKKRRLTRPRKL